MTPSGSRRSGVLTAALCGAGALAVYAATLQRSLPAGDSGELIAVARTLGVAHPPGYPLYTLLGHLWTLLIPIGSAALRMNLLSAVAAAGTVALLAGLVRRVTGSAPAAVAAAGLLAFALPFWKYALVAEVFAPNAFLAACMLWAGVAAIETGGPAPLAALAFLTALLLSHHHTLALLAVPVDLVALAAAVLPERAARRAFPSVRAGRLRPKAWSAVAGAGGVGLAPLLYLPWAAARHPVLNWDDPGTPDGFLHLLLRRDYGTFRLDPGQAGHVADRSHVLLWLGALPADLTWLGAALLVLGLAVLVRRRRGLAAMLLGYFALQAAFFTAVHFPATPLVFRGVVERFYILPATVAALPIGVGAAWLIGRAGGPAGRPARGRARRRPGRGRAAGALLAAAAVIWPLGTHWRAVDQRGNTFTRDLGRDVLASLPAHAVLFSQGDMFHNALAYLQLVDHERPDVTVVDEEKLTYPWYLRALRAREPDLLPSFGPADRYDDSPPTRNVHWCDHLRGRRPVAFLGVKDGSYAARYEFLPRGMVMLAIPKGSAPDLAAQADTALSVLAACRLDAYFRPYDPWSLEAESRWRFPELVSRTALLLCQPGTGGLTPANRPGFARLLEFVERHRASPDDPELLRAGGLLYALHPAVRDTAKARSDLTRYLASAPAGPGAEEARRVLAYLNGAGGGP